MQQLQTRMQMPSFCQFTPHSKTRKKKHSYNMNVRKPQLSEQLSLKTKLNSPVQRQQLSGGIAGAEVQSGDSATAPLPKSSIHQPHLSTFTIHSLDSPTISTFVLTAISHSKYLQLTRPPQVALIKFYPPAPSAELPASQNGRRPPLQPQPRLLLRLRPRRPRLLPRQTTRLPS